jgi:hypothetical protein
MAYEGDLKSYAPAEVDEVGAIILKARELLSDPAKWTQHHFNSKGQHCMLGALGFRRFSKRAEDHPAVKRISAHIPKTYYEMVGWVVRDADERVADFNDANSHADVLALLDRAASPNTPA